MNNDIKIKFINTNKLMFPAQIFFVTRRIAYAILIQRTHTHSHTLTHDYYYE